MSCKRNKKPFFNIKGSIKIAWKIKKVTFQKSKLYRVYENKERFWRIKNRICEIREPAYNRICKTKEKTPLKDQKSPFRNKSQKNKEYLWKNKSGWPLPYQTLIKGRLLKNLKLKSHLHKTHLKNHQNHICRIKKSHLLHRWTRLKNDSE